jgi:UDP-N-acetylglucosamine diphosphorylase/glucosamine-1-phosphate N-acetyltransferase
MHIIFFEDKYCRRFHPLTLTRPTDDLRTGILTIAQKWIHTLQPESFSRMLSAPLSGIFAAETSLDTENNLFINSRYLPDPKLVAQITALAPGHCLKNRKITIAARVDASTASRWLKHEQIDVEALHSTETSSNDCIKNVWDLFLKNGSEIEGDLQRLNNPSSTDITVSSQAVLKNEAQIFMGKDARIEPGAILMADEGPIYIGPGATVMAGAMIKGPAAICENAVVKMGAKIYPDTTVGPVCKVGGEINNSIFHSYSNKGHDGFVGNSIIGQWCNLGADTNTSNLKNNYSPVRITDWSSGDELETGQQFLGTIMGDHTKTAINTQLNTGTICGVSCNIFAGDFPPKHIPSFSWVSSDNLQTYKFDKALEAMEAMMARRDVELTEDYKKLMQHIFEQERG